MKPSTAGALGAGIGSAITWGLCALPPDQAFVWALITIVAGAFVGFLCRPD